MASIDLMLNSYSVSLPLPSEPAFFMNSTTNGGLPLEPEDSSSAAKSNNSQSRESANFSRNEALIRDLFPRYVSHLLTLCLTTTIINSICPIRIVYIESLWLFYFLGFL